jgi:glycosyltransferase involved in cell wall biosynthesis
MRADRKRRFVLVTADVEAVLDRLRGESESPRQDFLALAKGLNAEILSFSDVTRGSWFTRMLKRWISEAVALAWLGFNRRGSFYFVTAENTALPLALLLKFRRGITLVFIGHRLTTPIKSRMIKYFRLFNQISAILCYSRQQIQFLQSLGMPTDRAHRIAFQVDDRFFSPLEPFIPGHGVVSVGRELRDYMTLFQAMDGTGIPLTVVGSSPWSRREDKTRQRDIPGNVLLRKGLSSSELRNLYRSAAVVAVPLMNVDWPAGVTSLFEAQACGRPVVISASDGILDSLDPGAAVTVPCGDAKAMREAIIRLSSKPGEAATIANAGLESVRRARTLDHFVACITGICRNAEANGNKWA